jgi:hypothetical protein
MLIAVLALGVGAGLGAASFLRGKRFISSATFAPELGDDAQSRLSSLATQFGLNIPSLRGEVSLAFYADLVVSREILDPVARGSYRAGERADTQPLADILKIPRRDKEWRVERTVRKLRTLIDVSVDLASQVVAIRLHAASAELAHDLLSQVIDKVASFTLARRRTQAAAEREFLESRVAAASEELSDAEGAMEEFLIRNRDISNSPSLRFEQDPWGGM